METSENPKHLIEIDVYLLSLITTLAFINCFDSHISQLFLVFIGRQTRTERTLLERRRTLVSEQSRLNMVKDFAKYSKLQRQINAVDAELDELRQNRTMQNFITRIAVRHGVKIVLGLLLLFFSMYYRRTPVFILNEQYNLSPLETVISFPNAERNAVSVHVWIMCCTAVGHLIKT